MWFSRASSIPVQVNTWTLSGSGVGWDPNSGLETYKLPLSRSTLFDSKLSHLKASTSLLETVVKSHMKSRYRASYDSEPGESTPGPDPVRSNALARGIFGAITSAFKFPLDLGRISRRLAEAEDSYRQLRQEYESNREHLGRYGAVLVNRQLEDFEGRLEWAQRWARNEMRERERETAAHSQWSSVCTWLSHLLRISRESSQESGEFWQVEGPRR
jgi:hypothetical protein